MEGRKMNDRQRAFLIMVLVVLAFIVISFGMNEVFFKAQADFYECPPNDTLVICPVDETPNNKECRNVGSGTTTLPTGDCS